MTERYGGGDQGPPPWLGWALVALLVLVGAVAAVGLKVVFSAMERL